jgi:hypothetical protein
MTVTASTALSQNTLAPLGAYFDGQPNGNDASGQAYFEQQYTAFANLMGTRPEYYNFYTDFTQAPSSWGSSASWGAWSAAQTGDQFVGPGSGTIPVVGVPMADPTYQYATIDSFYKQVIAGQFDSDYTAIVDGWANEGYKTAEFRIGYEFNGSMAWTPPANGSDNADFVAAWQHIANLIHAEGTKDGITAETVWDPATSNGSSYDVQSLYPGDQYVDVISTDVYGGGTPNNLVDYATGGTTIDATYAAWAAKPANLEHYYLYENATTSNPNPGLGATGPTGYGWSVADTIAFAKEHNKPLGIDETGATSGQDDAVFPAWLASAVASARAQDIIVDHVDIWSNGSTTWNFLNGGHPLETAAWAAGFGAGSGTSSGTTVSVPPTISLSAPGTVQEASPGAGVTVTESITTTNLTGTAYEEVLTASGTVENGYIAVALTNGSASSSVFLANSGDRIQVVDNPTSPTGAATSAPVTITDPIVTLPSISVSAPGSVQEASVGAGVNAALTVTTTNLPGDVYYEVLKASGAVETPYAAALPAGAAITLPTTIPQQKANQTFYVQVAFNYVPIRANLEYSSTSKGVTLSPFASNSGITWNATGQIATIPILNGNQVPHYFQVVDTSTSTNLQSNEIIYQVGASGGGGTVTVTPPVPVGTTQSFAITPHLAAAGDVVRVVNNPTSPTVTATSSPVTITDPTTVAKTISFSPPGTVQEASFGAGVIVNETITTTGLTGNVYEEVLTAGGAVESGYTAVALVNGVGSSSVYLASSGDIIQVVDNPTTPTITADSSPVTITDPTLTPPSTITIGSGPDTLALEVSEDAWKGNAQFSVSVDGQQIGGTQTATALHSLGQTQIIDVQGTFAAGSHTATVDFLNDAYGGTSVTDRNLYVVGASIDGSTVPAATLSEYGQGPQSFSFLASGSVGSGPPVGSVIVNQPADLAAAVQTITGTVSDPSQPVFLDWRTYGTPALDAGDWVQATVNPGGQFTASMVIDHPGTPSTMFFHTGSGPVVAAWSATPT